MKVLVIPRDLSLAGAADQLYTELEHAQITVDILINNAGFGGYSAFVDRDWQNESAMIAVNITALTHLTKLFAKDMVARKSGRILNMASTAAFLPGPFMAVYYASKAYVLSFSEALANELQGTGVTVTALCPGPTATGWASTAGVERSRLFQYITPASAAGRRALWLRSHDEGKGRGCSRHAEQAHDPEPQDRAEKAASRHRTMAAQTRCPCTLTPAGLRVSFRNPQFFALTLLCIPGSHSAIRIPLPQFFAPPFPS